MLTISIDFTPSLAMYIWQSFRKGLWQAVQRPADVQQLWQITAEVCSTHGCIAASMTDASCLAALLVADPLQTFPADKLLHHLPSMSGASAPFVLPQVDPSAKMLLLFAQLLITVAAERKDMLDKIHAPLSSTAGQTLLRTAIASKLQQLTAVSNCKPVGLTKFQAQLNTPSKDLQSPTCASRRIVLLRAAVLVAKLATLVSNVKADVLGHADAEPPLSVTALWTLLTSLVRELAEIQEEVQHSLVYDDTQNNHSPIHADEHTQLSGIPDDTLVQQALCLALWQLLVPRLQQYTKEADSSLQAFACMHLLLYAAHWTNTEQLLEASSNAGEHFRAMQRSCLYRQACMISQMHVTTAGPVSCCQHIKDSLLCCVGAMPVLVAFLDSEWMHAISSLNILLKVCQPGLDASERNLDLLARLQGARRLSHLLRPSTQSKEGYAFQIGNLSPIIPVQSFMRALEACADKSVLCMVAVSITAEMLVAGKHCAFRWHYSQFLVMCQSRYQVQLCSSRFEPSLNIACLQTKQPLKHVATTRHKSPHFCQMKCIAMSGSLEPLSSC